ncbi:MAG: PA14 domain-containing protein, partial [Ginsengibacter sp.]
MKNKKRFHAIALALLFLIANVSYAWPPAKKFELTKDGVIVYPDSLFSGGTKAVRLQVISDKIMRITASADRRIPEVNSLITVYKDLKKKYTVSGVEGKVIIKTPSIIATVLTSTGAVSFTDAAGKSILMERQHNGRSITPAVYAGESSFNLSQTFLTAPGEAYYGLGQHQGDQFNYKDQQVLLFQNNTEVAVPFLLSSKNYGILWDNYSVTKMGDARNFMPLSTLKLFSKNGDEGWLTAAYNNDKNKPDEVSFTKAGSQIDYQYLGDSKKDLPADFNPQNGEVTWEGSIASGFSGMHKFRIIYAGYMKIWIDGKMLADRWRQAWNPGSALLNVSLQKDKKYAIKIQWIPDGTESYLDVKWLQP